MLQYIASRIYLLSRPVDINTDAIGYSITVLEVEDETICDIFSLCYPPCVWLIPDRPLSFYQRIYDLVGRTNYNSIVRDRIVHGNSITNESVSSINLLVSLTTMEELNIYATGKPHLAHLFKLPLSSYGYGSITDDSAKYILSIYTNDMLPSLLQYGMTEVSKSILQQILDITIRDHTLRKLAYINKFIYQCILKNCDVSKCRSLICYMSTYIRYLIQYAIDNVRQSQEILDKCVSWPDDLWTSNIGKAFFKDNFDKHAAIWLYTRMSSNGHNALKELIGEYTS